MVKVAGLWELGWNTPIKEMDLWEYPLREFNVSELIMSPVSGIKAKVTEVPTIEEAIQNNPELVPVFCHEQGEYELSEFKHPEEALYIFGKANCSPFNNLHKPKGSLSLQVRTPSSKGMLWPHQAASIILYDRSQKWQLQ
jgi:hypothetical protein